MRIAPAAIELRKSAPETEAVSLSSDEGGGEGRGEELGFIGFPLSPLVPRGARECSAKSLTAVRPAPGSSRNRNAIECLTEAEKTNAGFIPLKLSEDWF